MGRTVNLITDENSLFRSTLGGWVVTNATTQINLDETIDSRYGTLELTPLVDGIPVVLSLSGVVVSSLFGQDSVQFHARQKSSSTCVTTLTLSNSEGNSTVRDERTGISVWSILRANPLIIPNIGEDVLFDIEVSICEHQLQPIYFTIPFMYITGNIFRDRFLTETFLNLPDVIRQADITHEEQHGLPDFPLARLMELTTASAGEAVTDYYAFQYIDIEAGKDPNNLATLSQLVDPDAAQEEVLPWLSQFAGVILDNPSAGTTPWGKLPATWEGLQEDVDPTTNPEFTPTDITRASNVVTATIGSHSVVAGQWVSLQGSTATSDDFNGGFEVVSVDATTISWSQTGTDETALTFGTLTVVDTEWSEVEELDPGLEGLQDYLRWQVKYAYNGVNAGTRQALIGAVSRVLTGDKVVTVVERHEDNPWQILVKTKTSETPDGVDGVASEAVELYISRVKPAGFKVVHQCTVTGT